MLDASLADVIGTKCPRVDKGKEKVVATSKKQQPPTVPRKPGSLSIWEPTAATRPPSNPIRVEKETAAAGGKDGKASTRKRVRPTIEVPLIPATPEVESFSALEVLSNCLSEAAMVKRDDLARASTENTQDPAEETAKFLLAAGLRVLANSVSRKDLISERGEALEDAKKWR